MAYLPYADLKKDPETAAVAGRITADRGSVIQLYQMLLHSPPLADSWLGYLSCVRRGLSLPGALRELVIMRIAHLNRAPFEAAQHAPVALQEGLTQGQLDVLDRWDAHADAFSPLEQAALRLCDTMTREVQVPQAQMQALRALLPDRQIVELTATIAAYNMVSRFLEALHIHEDDAPSSP